jgi:undecaprenyl-diphosphatase
MEDILKHFLLGIIQGLTEFLPVSSSGHIELTKFFLGFEPENNLLFTVVVHFATALSTIVVFRQEIIKIFKGLLSRDTSTIRFSGYIIISMIPAALIGVFLDDLIESFFDGMVLLVICCLLISAFLLIVADASRYTNKHIGWKEAIIIGIAQAIAILPGISRSGATIATSVILKVNREEAARFSFLMVVPLIFGKMAKDVMDGALTDADIHLLPLFVGFIAAFFVGIIACNWMIKLVVKSNLKIFSFYLLFISAVASIWYFLQ